MIELKAILNPTDFSESSRHASEYACSLARKYKAKLYLLHVIEEVSSAMYFDMMQTPPLVELMAEVEEQARRALDDALPPDLCEGIEVESVIRRGVPFLEIVLCAKELNCDLIVCGSHGRTGLKHALFGSVAEKVVRKAPCPVLSVRHPEHKFEMPSSG